MKLHGFLRVMCFLSILLAAVGCGTMRTYKGPPRPENEVALIVGAPGTKILRVDGKDLGFYSCVEVLPGQHTVEWRCFTGGYSMGDWEYGWHINFITELYAEPGEMYELKGGWEFAGTTVHPGTKAYVTPEILRKGKYKR